MLLLLGVPLPLLPHTSLEGFAAQFMEECRGYERNKTAMVIGLMAPRFRELVERAKEERGDP